MDYRELVSRLIGIYLIGDGILSIVMNRDEPWKEHLPRIARAIMGTYIALTADSIY